MKADGTADCAFIPTHAHSVIPNGVRNDGRAFS